MRIINCNVKLIIILTISTLVSSCTEQNEEVTIEISDKVLYEIEDNIFGHFFEKCNWDGEIGADLSIDKESMIVREDVKKLMDSLNIPILRFPGGTDVDYYEWTELIDIPERIGGRPNYDGRNGNVVSKNEMGLDEFLQLGEELRYEPLLVVNLGDAYFNIKTPKEAAYIAASMVAYCNTPIENNLPEKYKKWPELRAKNGHPEPYYVNYFQIGNEVWLYDKPNLDRFKEDMNDSILKRYYGIVEIYINEMKLVDSTIQIIIDANSKGFIWNAEKFLDDKYDFLSFHHYVPWSINIIKDSEGNTYDSISIEDMYYAWVTTPYIDTLTGQSSLKHPVFLEARKTMKKIAITEWNWNGWLSGELKKNGNLGSDLAKGIGAASYIHAIMRNGDLVKIANQSMLLGQSWGITSIRIDKETQEIFLLPTGIVTGMYSQFHGKNFLETKVINNIFYSQKYRIGGIKPSKQVAILDVLTTQEDSKYFVHIINRHFSDTISAIVKLPKNLHAKSGTKYEMNGTLKKSVLNNVKLLPETVLSKSDLQFRNKNKIYLEVAPHSVNIFIFETQK